MPPLVSEYRRPPPAPGPTEVTTLEDAETYIELSNSFPRLGLAVDDKYKLVKLIGRGGMAEVWKARVLNADFEDYVALKVYVPSRDEATDAYGRKAFERELKLMRRLHSQHIPAVRDQGSIGDRPYFVMRLLEGATLEARLVNTPKLPWREALKIVAEVAKALVPLHALGYVHRDVKPGNIFLQSVGGVYEAYLLDFGIAAPVGGYDDGGPRTASLGTNATVGTPEYMAPEQHLGHAMPASDLYGLGVIAYLAITGELPFQEERNRQGHAHANYPVPPIEDPNIPTEVKALVLELLEKIPDNRPSEPGPLVERIQRILLTAKQPTAMIPGWANNALAGALIAVVALIAYLLLGTPRLPNPKPGIVDPPVPADPAVPSGFISLDELGARAASLYRQFTEGEFDELERFFSERVSGEPAPAPVLLAALSIVQSKLTHCPAAARNLRRLQAQCPDCASQARYERGLKAVHDACMGRVVLDVQPRKTRVRIVRTDGIPVREGGPYVDVGRTAATLPIGNYRITATHDGCRSKSVQLTIKPGQTRRQTLRLDCS